MLEDFLKDIYDKALTLELLKEASFFSNIRHPFNRRDFWNDAMVSLDHVLDDLKQSDVTKCRELYEGAEKAQKCFGDPLRFASAIDVDVIPKVADYLAGFTGIDVSEGKWTLESSSTGFLTIRKTKDLYVHSPSDPMWESFLYAYKIYDPSVRRYNILGGGLGYLAYQLWRISEGDADIYIYEIDDEIQAYADLYGVVSMMDPDKIHYVCDDDKDNVLEKFFEDISETKIIRTVYYWDATSYDGLYEEHIRFMRTNEVTARVFDSKWKNNYVWNKSFEYKPVSELDTSSFRDEWVVVASGPSLNDNEEFIRDSMGKRTICAVNSSFKWFYLHNIKPDICTVCDPKDSLQKHIEGFEDYSVGIPLIADCVASRKFIELYKGPRYYVVSTASADIADDSLDCSDVWSYGGTVTSMALETALRYGAKKIYLVGADMGYPEGVTFAEGVSHSAQKLNGSDYMVISVEDVRIPSSFIFLEYKSKMEEQIAGGFEAEVINKSLHGAYLKGTYCGKWWEDIPNTNQFSDYTYCFDNLKCDSLILGWREKYYVLWQLLARMETNGISLTVEEESIIQSAYNKIYEELKNELNWSPSGGGKMNSNQTYIFTEDYWDCKSASTKKTLNAAKEESRKKHAVLIVNTSEKFGGEKMPIRGSVAIKYNKEMENADRVEFENRTFSYIQFSKGMPDIKYYSIFLDSLAQNKPGKLVITDKYSLLADLCRDYFNIPTEIL